MPLRSELRAAVEEFLENADEPEGFPPDLEESDGEFDDPESSSYDPIAVRIRDDRRRRRDAQRADRAWRNCATFLDKKMPGVMDMLGEFIEDDDDDDGEDAQDWTAFFKQLQDRARPPLPLPGRDGDNLRTIATMFEAEDVEQDGELNEVSNEEEIEVEVAQDSGCVAHVTSPELLPGSVEVRQPEGGGKLRRFVAANGTPIKNYGISSVMMVQPNGRCVGGTFQVTDVTRPLHSTSQICDSQSKGCPEGHEVLFTSGVATVVPAGTFSKYLDKVRHIADYPRQGGLYVSKMKLRRPTPDPAAKSSFTRQGQKR